MKVIIKKTNEIKEVKDGYGRNFLVPKGLAILATPQAVARIEQEKKRLKKQTKKLAEKLEKKVIEMSLKIGEKGKVFGAITAQKIAQKLNLNKKQVLLEEPIKKIGKYKIFIDLGQGVKPQLSLLVSGRHQSA